MLVLIEEKMVEDNKVLVNSGNPDERWAAYQAVAALKALKELYTPVEPQVDAQGKPIQPAQPAKPGFTTQAKNPATRSVDRRVRNVDRTQPNEQPNRPAQGGSDQNAE